MVLANSITLTPGTITVTLEEDEYLVHCLDRELGEGIESCSFEKRLEELERKRRLRFRTPVPRHVPLPCVPCIRQDIPLQAQQRPES